MGSADQASQTGPIKSIDVEPFVVEIMGGTGFASESQVVWLSGEIDLAATVFGGVEVQSMDYDHNIHCAFAERERNAEVRSPLLR